MSIRCIKIAIHILTDKETIIFQGLHTDKLQYSNYKRAGYGFQRKAICADGYSFFFYFCKQAAPNNLIDKDLSSLHARCLSLLQ